MMNNRRLNLLATLALLIIFWMLLFCFFFIKG